MIRVMPTPISPAGMEGLDAIASRPDRALLAFDLARQDDVRGGGAAAQEGPWVTYARMNTLRSPKQLTGPALRFPALTFRAWYEAQFGREQWDAASRTTMSAPPEPGIEAVREEVTRLLGQPGAHQGAWLEDKGSAVAVHTRRAADPAAALAALRGPVNELAERHHLRVEPGKMVLEIRPHGVQKGDVLQTIVRDRDAQAVLYAGDDLGDLSAFAAVDELRENGVPGVKVCSGSPEAPEVAEAADVVVDGPAGVADFLETLGQRIDMKDPQAPWPGLS